MLVENWMSNWIKQIYKSVRNQTEFNRVFQCKIWVIRNLYEYKDFVDTTELMTTPIVNRVNRVWSSILMLNTDWVDDYTNEVWSSIFMLNTGFPKFVWYKDFVDTTESTTTQILWTQPNMSGIRLLQVKIIMKNQT